MTDPNDEPKSPSVTADHNSNAVGSISVGGDISGNIHIGNVYQTPEDDLPLSSEEIENGLTRFAQYLPERAPVLQDSFSSIAKKLRATLGADQNSLSPAMKTQREDGVNRMKLMCMEVTDISFRAICLGQNPPPYDSRPPFLGLFAFRPEDREFFFGRDALVQKLVARIKAHPFLAVLGASGSGKSSLVMAGLVPALEAQMSYLTPSSAPLSQLLAAKESASAKTVFVIDQFEELFTHPHDATECADFIHALLELTKTNRVVITMRADFWGEVAIYADLKQAMQEHQELIAPMTVNELHSAMEKQAAVVGLRFDPTLSESILADVKGEPGAMPLLQHALWELWNRRHGLWIKAEEYQAFGGVKQAIASTAEEVYASCSDFERARVRDIFLRLTRLDESDEGRDTRRRVLIEELIPVNSDSSVTINLLNKLADARLIVKTEADVEVAHEALIRHWSRLTEWLNEDRDNLRLREGVSESAREWDASKRDDSLLNHRGGRLELALAMSKLPRYQLNPIEQTYLNACVALKNKEQRERERRLRYTVIASIAAAVIFLVLGSFGLVKSNEATARANDAATAQLKAEEQANIAVGRSAVLQSVDQRDKQLGIAFLLGIEANKRLNNSQSRSVLFDNLRISPRLQQFSYNEPMSEKKNISPIDLIGGLKGYSISSDGKTIVASYDDGKIRVWDESAQKVIGELGPDLDGHDISNIGGLAIDPNGEKIAFFTNIDAFVYIWDVNTKALINTPIEGEDFITNVSFSNNGKFIAFGNSINNIIDIYDVEQYQQVSVLFGEHSNIINCISFSPDDKILASGSVDGTIVLWDWGNGGKINQYPNLIGHKNGVTHLEFSPDGKNLFSWDGNNTRISWSIDLENLMARNSSTNDSFYNGKVSSDGKLFVYENYNGEIAIYNIITGQTVGTIITSDKLIALDPVGNILTYSNETGSIILWNAATQKPAGPPFFMETGIVSASFSADGKTLATGNDLGVITLRDMATNSVIDRLEGHTDSIMDIKFSMDGKILVSSSLDNKLFVWDLATKRPINQPLESNGVMAVSPNGKILAYGDIDGVPIILDIDKFEPIGESLEGHIEINNLSFNNDGSILASSGNDSSKGMNDPSRQTVILWDPISGKPLGQPIRNFLEETSVSAVNYFTGMFSLNGNTFLTYDNIGDVTLWDINIQSWINRSCQIVGRNFTRAEWDQYFSGENYRATCPQWPLEPTITSTSTP